MTRNEQILSEVQKRFSSNDTHLVSKISTFIDGAKWADAHPNPNTIKKIFEFALEKTNFLIADNLESIDWKVLIKKAMEE